VIVVGIRALRGHMDWTSAIWVIAGIVIIFGAAGIVDFVRDNAGTL
jgi:type IV secretory pathway VirB2 component (pilin)